MEKMEFYDPVEINAKNIKEKLNYDDITDKKKLVLIQAPSDFDIKSLTGQRLVLEGHQNLPADENKDKRYEIKSSMNCRKNMKVYNVIAPSFENRKYCVARPIRGSIIINQTIKVPPVQLPENEEVVLPHVPKRLLREWVPFGADDPVKVEKTKKARKRRQEETNQLGSERSFEIISSKTEVKEVKEVKSKIIKTEENEDDRRIKKAKREKVKKDKRKSN